MYSNNPTIHTPYENKSFKISENNENIRKDFGIIVVSVIIVIIVSISDFGRKKQIKSYIRFY